MTNESCEGCMYLCGDGTGYSDWTWMDTHVVCILRKNKWLEENEYEQPMDWKEPSKQLKRMALFAGMRCDSYEQGEYITITPDGNLNADSHVKKLPRKLLVAIATYRFGNDDFYNIDDIIKEWQDKDGKRY